MIHLPSLLPVAVAALNGLAYAYLDRQEEGKGFFRGVTMGRAELFMSLACDTEKDPEDRFLWAMEAYSLWLSAAEDLPEDEHLEKVWKETVSLYNLAVISYNAWIDETKKNQTVSEGKNP